MPDTGTPSVVVSMPVIRWTQQRSVDIEEY